jgi:hypothetical protein
MGSLALSIQVLRMIARKLEFIVHSLSTTQAGYESRAAEKIRAVEMLTRANVWMSIERLQCEEMEDSKEVADMLRRACCDMKGKKHVAD